LKTALRNFSSAREPEAINRTYYPALDGLRGLAILLVVIYHNFNFINYSYFGWLGVDLFFVLSGYLITDILLKTLAKKNYLKNFYFRRVLRIFPLYYLSLFIFLIILLKISNLDFDYYANNQIWLWTFLQNWLYIFKPPPSHSVILNHYWSLAVEEQFYAFWPLVILLLRKIKYLFFFIASLLVLVLLLRYVVWIYHIEDLAYFNLYTFSRIDGICIGCMVALIQKTDLHFLSRNTAWIIITFAGLNFLFDFVNRHNQFSFPFFALIGYTTFAMIFGLLVHEATLGKSHWIKAIFSVPILRFLGRISYGLYIFHWPVYIIAYPYVDHLSKNLLENTSLYSLHPFCSSIICTIGGIVISILSYRFFEIYFLKLKKNFK